MSVKPRKLYKTYYPRDLAVYKKDRSIIFKYGLRNKAEVRKIEFKVQKYRNVVKTYDVNHPIYQNVVTKLIKKGIIANETTDILLLEPENILERCLQNLVYKTFNCKSILEARQIITSGRIKVNNVKCKRPMKIMNMSDIITKIE
jgi:ribosomal protein S4